MRTDNARDIRDRPRLHFAARRRRAREPVRSAPRSGRDFLYPRDDTSGCTKEAVAFSGLQSEFDAAGATVIGISKDSVASHEKFRDKHDLTVPLLSDAEDAICEAYGVWTEKNMYGKKFMGIERSTFLIDGTGRIARVWRKVKVPGHAEEVLEAVRAL